MTASVLQGDKTHKNREMEHYSSANIKKNSFPQLHEPLQEDAEGFISQYSLLFLLALVLLVPYFST